MARPQLVYDDSCGFCIWATEFAVRYGPFEPISFSETTAAQRERLPEEYEECAHVLTDQGVYSCGESVRGGARTNLPGTDDCLPHPSTAPRL